MDNMIGGLFFLGFLLSIGGLFWLGGMLVALGEETPFLESIGILWMGLALLIISKLVEVIYEAGQKSIKDEESQLTKREE